MSASQFHQLRRRSVVLGDTEGPSFDPLTSINSTPPNPLLLSIYLFLYCLDWIGASANQVFFSLLVPCKGGSLNFFFFWIGLAPKVIESDIEFRIFLWYCEIELHFFFVRTLLSVGLICIVNCLFPTTRCGQERPSVTAPWLFPLSLFSVSPPSGRQSLYRQRTSLIEPDLFVTYSCVRLNLRLVS